MADNTTGQPIGTGRVDITANIDPLKAKVGEAQDIVKDLAATPVDGGGDGVADQIGNVGAAAEAASQPVRSFRLETEQFAKDTAKAERTSAQFAKSLEESGESAKRQIGKVKSFIGSFAAVGGIAVSMFALGRAIRESVETALESGTTKAERFAASLDFADAKGSISALDGQLKELQSRLAANSESVGNRLINSINGNSNSQLREQINYFNQQRAGLAKSARRREDIEKEADERKAAQEEAARKLKAEQELQDKLLSLRTQAESDALSGESKIAYDTETRIIELDKLRKKATADQQRDIDAVEQMYRESARRQVQALREAREEERRDNERREKESAERIARAYSDAMTQAQERINAQAQQLNPVNQQVLTTLIGIKDTLDAIGSQRDRRAL